MSRLSVVSADKVNSTTEQLMKEFTQRIVANPPGVCPVDMQLAFLKVCHAQTCGKCVPCRIGLGQLEDLLEKVLDNEATMDTLKLIEQTAENIKNSADCAIGFESARMVLAGLEGFKEDYISHITEHRCLGSFEQPIPCVTLCPAHVDIPAYIALAGEGRCEDAVRLMEEKGADLINIKLMKTGGIHEAVRICDAADQFGVKCMIGCMLESKVSVSAGVHLAAARSCVTMADLDGPSLCRIDPYEGGPVYEGPHIFLKEDNGIGITGVPVKFETI